MAGRPITMDACTEALLKGTFTRVCMEIDIMKLLVPEVLLGSPDYPD